MIEILTTLSSLVALGLGCLSVYMIYHTKRWSEDKIEEMVERAKGFYATEKKDLVEGLPSLVGKMLIPSAMSKLGEASGISRQLKGLENEVIQDGLGNIVGPAAAPMIAKYVQKYPIILQVLPQLMQGLTKNTSSSGAPQASNSTSASNDGGMDIK